MLKQGLRQKLQQKMLPQQIQIVKLLETPLSELELRIKEELESNPTLEEVQTDEVEGQNVETTRFDEIPSYRLYANNYSIDDEREANPISDEESFQEFLYSQLSLSNLDEKQIIIGRNIIGNIDSDGYLRRELKLIINDMAFSSNLDCSLLQAEQVLYVIHKFDPAGVGARTLQECLLLQLDRRPVDRIVKLAISILDECFDSFSKKHFPKIAKQLACTDEELKDAVSVILKLNPKPGSSMPSHTKNMGVITPDFIIEYDDDGEIQLSLNQKNIPDLIINSSYSVMLDDLFKSKIKQSKLERETSSFIRQKLDSAKWFIEAIKQRQKTLFMTMSAIVEFQYEFFMEGDESLLKPMILKDIASRTGYDISTISRVSNSKYVYTPFGMFAVKYFFSESLQTDSGDEVSTREVKSILLDVMNNENKNSPLTDESLAAILKDKGYQIARRTVAKYREQLNIPIARMRKELQ